MNWSRTFVPLARCSRLPRIWNAPPLPTAPPTADDTAELLRRCADGDRAAFRTLYDHWGARLHGMALRITRQSGLAADTTHDAFVQVCQQAYRFDPARGSAEAFCHRPL